MYTAAGPIFNGKKVMFTKNYKKTPTCDAVKNGELGQVKRVIDDKHFELVGGKKISLDHIDPKHVHAGYATTCNKAQGSEWEQIIFWIYENPNRFFTREFMYVAVSRAKRKCTVVGKMEEVHQICREKAKERNTLLRFYLYLAQCKELEQLTSFDNVVLMPSNDMRLLPMGALSVPTPPTAEEKKKKKKHKINGVFF